MVSCTILLTFITYHQLILGYSRPQFGSHQNGNLQSSKSDNPSTSRKLPQPPKQSIQDKYEWMDEDDDHIFIIASQNAEEQMNQKRQQVNEEHNNTYQSFNPSIAGTSTQSYHKTGNTDIIRNNLFVDLTVDPVENPPSQMYPPIGRVNELQTQASSSQKENISTQQALTKQQNKIKALEIQLINLKSSKAELQEKLNAKEGETSNLRRDKKTLEDQIRETKLQRMKEADMSKTDPEKERLRKENANLKVQLQFEAHNKTMTETRRHNATILEEQQTTSPIKPNFVTNINLDLASNMPTIPSRVFEPEENIANPQESSSLSFEREISSYVNEMQMRLAQVHSFVITGANFDELIIDSAFGDAAYIIRRLSAYINYLESESIKDIVFDNDPAYTACALISIPVLREKLTRFDPIRNTLDKHDGFISVYQAEKLYPEEVCVKPRRIIALYATFSRLSKSFSEKLLLEKISVWADTGVPDGHDQDSTFVSVLIDILKLKISESDNVYDYFGLAIASAELLAGLGSHYSEYANRTEEIDECLTKLLRAVLECQCDSPLLMKHLAEFLASVSMNPTRTGIISKLCVRKPRRDIIESNRLKYCEYPEDACTFQLFLLHLLTSFNFSSELNQLEHEVLLETTLNLNRITSNIQEMNVGTLQFFKMDETCSDLNCCGCFNILINTLLTLNHLALLNRNSEFKQTPRQCKGEVSSDQQNGRLLKRTSGKCK